MPYDIVHEQLLQNAAGATGDGEVLDFGTGGVNTVAFQVEISNTATVTFECSLDGITWYAIQAASVTSGTPATTATASGIYQVVNAGAITYFRTRVSAWTSGTVTVLGRGQP